LFQVLNFPLIFSKFLVYAHRELWPAGKMTIRRKSPD